MQSRPDFCPCYAHRRPTYAPINSLLRVIDMAFQFEQAEADDGGADDVEGDRQQGRHRLQIVRRLLRDPHEVARWLGRVLNGWLNYYAVPTSAPCLKRFERILKWIWLRALRRRSQRDRFSWQQLHKLTDRYWPSPVIRHPWPSARFAVKHPR